MARGGRRPVIYLIGTAGHPNYGDELIAASWLRFYAERFPDAEIWLDTPRPGQTSVLHAGTHERLRCVDTVFHACWNAPVDDPAATIEFGASVVREPGRLAREASGFRVLPRADLIHVLGGAYLNGFWPAHLAILGAVQEAGRIGGGSTALTGAALHPMVDGAAGAIGEALATFRVVDVRDERTAALLASTLRTATDTCDDAMLDLQRQRTDRTVRAGTIVAIQSDLLEQPLERLAEYVLTTLRAWNADQEPVLLLEMMPPSDSDILPLLQPHLPELVHRPFEHLWRDGWPVTSGQRWITTRFHAHLLGAAAGDWGIALPADETYHLNNHQALLQQGSEWAVVTNLDTDAPQPPATTAAFGGRFGELVAAKRRVAQAVATLVGAS
jgi:polysaccharide pyruvyl transferase WcaK-like protein